MNKKQLIIFAFLLTGSLLFGATIYVKHDAIGSNNGTKKMAGDLNH